MTMQDQHHEIIASMRRAVKDTHATNIVETIQTFGRDPALVMIEAKDKYDTGTHDVRYDAVNNYIVVQTKS